MEVAKVAGELERSCLYLDLSRTKDQVGAVVIDSLDLLLCGQHHWLAFRTNGKEQALRELIVLDELTSESAYDDAVL